MGYMPEVQGAQALSLQDDAQARAQLADYKAKMYSAFSALRDKWVTARAGSGVETRWRAAERMYQGEIEDAEVATFESTLRNGPSRRTKGPSRSRVSVNIVRPKVNVAVARLCEIQLPVEERNYALELTPDPELEDALGDPRKLLDPQTGQPIGPVSQAAADEKAQLEKHMAAANRRIDDFLTECRFAGEQRRVIETGVRLGTGVIKGPFPVQRTLRRRGGEALSDIRPASKEVSCWHVYPDPSCGNDIQRGSGIFERRPVTRKELRALVDVPGYDAEAIRAVLTESPRRVAMVEGKVTRQSSADESYDLWEYHGEVDSMLLCDLPLFMHEPQQAGLLNEKGDPLLVDRAVVVMVQDRIIGMLPPWSEDLPYDFWCWRAAEDSPFGYGLPDELAHQQRVVTSCWRQVMDNASLSSGGILAVKKGVVESQDGDYTLSTRKVYLVDEEVDDIRKAMHVQTFPSIVGDLLSVLKAANELADQESNMPLLMQGDVGSGPDTFGGLALLWRQSNSPLRHKVKRYDDNIIVPHLTRYYNFVRDNNPDDPDFGHDYQVVARGAVALFERDMQQQGLLAVAKLLENPVFQPLLMEKAPQALRAIIRGFSLDPDQFGPTEDELKQRKAQAANNPPPPEPPDPQVVRAQTQLQVKQLDMQDRAEDRAAAERKQERELAYKRESLAYNQAREQAEFQIAMTQADLERVLAMLEMQKDGEESAADRALRERLELVKIDNQRQLFNAESARGTNIAGGV